MSNLSEQVLASSSPFPLNIDEQLILHSVPKRLLDLFLSAVALIICAPLLLWIACLIKSTSKGPIFYRSDRIGRKGKLFSCWKFRSMYTDADDRLEAVLKADPELNREWQAYFKLKRDPRLTTAGKFLRSTSLDELPQIWNVLKGDLSLVGPRPYLPREIEKIRSILGTQVDELFSVRPGLTGLWQTAGRNCLTFEERVRMEVLYPGQRSFALDLKLIAKTVPILLLRRGAF